MSVQPPSNRPMPPSRGRSNLGEGRSDDAARTAEKSSLDRVRVAEDAAREAERNSANRIEEVQDRFEKNSEIIAARNDVAFEAERQKGYEAIRNLKRAQEAELRRTRREGERTLDETRAYYRRTLHDADKNAGEQLQQMQTQNARADAYERKLAETDMQARRTAFSQDAAAMRTEHEMTLKGLKETNVKDYETRREQYQNAREDAQKKMESQYQETLTENSRTLDNLNRNAGEQLRQIRADTSQRLGAYNSRQSDPFYKLMDVGASLREYSDEYVLTADIPVHEQKHVSISVSGNRVNLSGYRRNQEELEIEPGHNTSTASYQSYNESFAVDWPIDPKSISKEFEGDTLVVRIPKRAGHAAVPQHKAPKVEKMRAERPQFPKNIPDAEARAQAQAAKGTEDREDEVSDRPKPRPGRTLT